MQRRDAPVGALLYGTLCSTACPSSSASALATGGAAASLAQSAHWQLDDRVHSCDAVAVAVAPASATSCAVFFFIKGLRETDWQSLHWQPTARRQSGAAICASFWRLARSCCTLMSGMRPPSDPPSSSSMAEPPLPVRAANATDADTGAPSASAAAAAAAVDGGRGAWWGEGTTVCDSGAPNGSPMILRGGC